MRVGVKRVFAVDDQVILLTAKTAKFSLHANVVTVAVVCHFLHQRDVFSEWMMRSVDHRRADPALDFLRNIVEIFVMIEVDRQWLVVRFGQIAGDGDHVPGSGIAKRTGCTRDDQGGAHFRGRFNDHLQRFEIMNIECRYGVPFALCF